MRSIDPQLLATVMGGCKHKQQQPQPQQAQPQQPPQQGQAQAMAMVQAPPQRRKMAVDVQVGRGGAPQSMDGGDSATA